MYKLLAAAPLAFGGFAPRGFFIRNLKKTKKNECMEFFTGAMGFPQPLLYALVYKKKPKTTTGPVGIFP